MKRIFITLTLLLFSISPMFAHYLWLETDRTGSLNKEQEVRVYFGEYTYGVIEKVKGENYPSVSKFTLWLIHPNGKKTALKISSKEEYFTCLFLTHHFCQICRSVSSVKTGNIGVSLFENGVLLTC